MLRRKRCAQLGVLPLQFGQLLAVVAHRGIFQNFWQRVRRFAGGLGVFCLVGDAVGLRLRELVLYFFKARLR